jgi:uncharacterized protein with HEPN domain
MKKDPRVYLAHILECIDRVEQYTHGGREAFFREALIQDAVIRNMEIIGEAAKRVDDDYRTANPQIPWRGMAALRDVLIHQYDGVDLDRVWAVVEGDLLPIKQAITAVLPPLEQLERELAGEANDSEEAPE